jgi:hypothetical protein
MVKSMDIFWSFKIKEGSRYKQKKIWGDKKIILGGQNNYFEGTKL